MSKILVSFIVLVFSATKIAAQTLPAESKEELVLAIQKSKPDTGRISLQIKLGDYYILKPENNPEDFTKNEQRAARLYNEALQLSIALHETDWQHKALAMLAFCYSQAGDKERCKQTYLRVIAYYHGKGDFRQEALTWESLADRYHYNESQYFEETISYYQHARALYLRIHQPLQAAITLRSIAGRRIVNKQFDVAEKELQQVLAQYKASAYEDVHGVYRTLHELEYDKGNYYKAMAYCLQAINSIKSPEDSLSLASFYAETAKCNYAVGKYEESLEWIRKALLVQYWSTEFKCIQVQILTALNKTDEARTILNSLFKEVRTERISWSAILFYRTLALYYGKVNDLRKSVRYYSEALHKIARYTSIEESKNTLYVMCNNEVADILLNANQAAEARQYIDNTAFALKNSKTALDPRFFAGFHHNAYRFNLATGNYQAAVNHLENHVRLKDSLFSAEKDRQLAELNIQYETAQKEQSIKLLHSEGAAQQARLQKAHLQRNITIGGILVMIAVSALFYRNYKQKNAANKTITQNNKLLQHLLTEKEWLLKEIHHRVKNNLQIIMSLLNSQSAFVDNEPALSAIRDSQRRVHSMSLIHQKLYNSDNISSINLSSFIPELASYLTDSFNTGQRIRFEYDIAPLDLDVSQAIPLALILNEAITNSIKYAFPDDRNGVIQISLLHAFSNNYLLTIADNGIGMPGINKKKSGSLGMSLMAGLSEDLEGSFSIENTNGTTIKISFVHDTSIDRLNIPSSAFVTHN